MQGEGYAVEAAAGDWPVFPCGGVFQAGPGPHQPANNSSLLLPPTLHSSSHFPGQVQVVQEQREVHLPPLPESMVIGLAWLPAGLASLLPS